MSGDIVNRALLPGNTCFGCGHENPKGLKIEIRRDPENTDRLVGLFNPGRHEVGFPGITHGGAIYTALDCMAFWAPTILNNEIKAFWILRSANIRYLKPAREGKPLALSACIEQTSNRWESVCVRTEARDERGKLLAEAQFEVVPLPLEKFKKIVGFDELPKNWSDFITHRG